MVATVDPTPRCGVTHTGDPPPAAFTESARVPSVSFKCPDAMNDPPVSIPVVKLAYMTPSASDDKLHFNTPDLPTPCSIPPLLPPPEPPPVVDTQGNDHDGSKGPTAYFPAGSIADDRGITRPSSPSTPFEFPENDGGAQYFDCRAPRYPLHNGQCDLHYQQSSSVWVEW